MEDNSLLVADSENNGREEVMSLVANLMTFQARPLLWRPPSSCTLTTTTTARDPSRRRPGRYGATLATRIK